MAANAGIITKLEYGSTNIAGTPSYTELSGLTNIEPGGLSSDFADVTTNQTSASGAVRFKKKMYVATDPGQLSFDHIIGEETGGTTAQVATLIGLLGLERAWRATVEDGSTFVSDGVLGSEDLSSAITDAVSSSWEVELTGTPTWTAA